MTITRWTALSLVLLAGLLALSGLNPLMAQQRNSPAAGSGWMGVMLGEAPSGGVGISRILDDGPAMRAGLRAGDIIVEVDGVKVESTAGLIGAVSGMDRGSWVSMTIDRGGKNRELKIRLEGRPLNLQRLKYREGYIGIDAIDIPQSLREHFGAPEDAGAMVSEVLEGEPAYIAGLELGDVIYEINGTKVGSAGHLLSLIGGGGVENDIEIRLMRDGLEIVLEATVVDTPEEARQAHEEALQEMRRQRALRQRRNPDR